MMKSLKYLVLVAILGLSSCFNITEEIFLQQNGSGKYVTTIDIKQLMDMIDMLKNFSPDMFKNENIGDNPLAQLDSIPQLMGKMEAISEDQSADQFEILQNWSLENGFEHYEISNLAKEGGIAQHNSSYWKGAHYLGIGPSAHSFNGDSRSVNVPNNTKYIRAIEAQKPEMELEEINADIRFNELVLTGLRTKWGIQKQDLIKLGKKYVQHFQQQSLVFREKKMIEEVETAFILSRKAWLNADGIAGKLFI